MPASRSNVITNVTANPIRRVDLVIGIGYDDDIKKAKEVILAVLTEEKANSSCNRSP